MFEFDAGAEPDDGSAPASGGGDLSPDVRGGFEELLPRRRRGLVLLFDALQCVADRSPDVALVGTDDLRLQLQRRGRKDLAHGGVAEELAPEALHLLASEQPRLAGELAGLLEDVRLGGR